MESKRNAEEGVFPPLLQSHHFSAYKLKASYYKSAMKSPSSESNLYFPNVSGLG